MPLLICFSTALSLKYSGKIFHVLIEKVSRYVRFKDSEYLFPSLADMIKHHCFHVHGKVFLIESDLDVLYPLHFIPNYHSFLRRLAVCAAS